MYCRKCGKEVGEQTRFCPGCGSDIKKTQAAAPVSQSQNQQTQNESYYVNLPSQPQIEVGQPANVISQSSKNTHRLRKYTLWISAIAIIAIAAVIISVPAYNMVKDKGYLIFNNNNDTTSTTSDSVTPASTPEASPTTESDPEVSSISPTSATNTISDSEIDNIINTNIYGAKVGIYVKNLSTGYTYGYNEKIILPSSAMSYIPIMLAVADYANSNNINLDSDGMIFNYMVNGMEKPNSEDDDGMYFSIRNYIETVAKYGDNNRSNALVDWIGNGNYKTGFSYINSLIRQQGYTSTKINRKIYTKEEYIDQTVEPNSTCAYDVANLFDDLLSNGYIGDRNYMKRICQYTNSKEQPNGIRKEFVGSIYNIANHYAINDLSQNEVASFSDGNKEVLIAVLVTLQSNNPENTDDEEARARAIKQLFNHIVQNQFAL